MNINWEPSRASGAAERSRLTKCHCYNKVALDRIVGTPTNPRPDGCGQGSTSQETVHHAEMG